MFVYSVLRVVDYEGSDLLGVFVSRADAIRFIQSLDEGRRYGHLGIIESALGQEIDQFGVIDFID